MATKQDSLFSDGVAFSRRAGSSAAIVFLHGIGSNARSFDGLVPHLPHDWDVLAWNAPGYLGSAPLKEMWPCAGDYARRLEVWLTGLKREKVHIVGHSLGTLIAAAFARTFPDRLASLTLASCACGYGVPKGGVLAPKVQARITDLAELGPQVFAERRAANLVFESDRNPDQVRRVQDAMAQVNLDGYRQAVHMLASGDLPSDLAHVPMEPHFIIGSEDRVTPLDQTRKAADAWARAHGKMPRITEIAGAGHAVYVQKPTAFAAALRVSVAHSSPLTRCSE